MEEAKMVRKGVVLRDESGRLLLVNEDNEAYVASESVVAIWDRCDGKTVDELADEVAQMVGQDTGEVREAISELIGKLREAKLIE